MLAFEVHLNGKKVCTAAMGEPGVLSSIVTWHLGDGAGRPKGQEELDLAVSALVSRTQEHVDWLKRRLRRGDEVSIRIVEAAHADSPKRRKRENPVQRRRQQQIYVRRLAKQFGWNIETR